MARIRVVLADDHPIVREGIRNLLAKEADIEVVGEAGDGTEALHVTRTHTPDVLVLDVKMPGMSGIEVAQALAEEGIPVGVLALTSYDDRYFVREMMESGASGYLLKDSVTSEIAKAVRSIARDEGTWISPRAAANAFDKRRGAQRTWEAWGLTEREVEVLKLVGKGYTNEEISAEWVISPDTVHNHVSHIRRKTGAKHRGKLVALAWEHGLVRCENGEGAEHGRGR